MAKTREFPFPITCREDRQRLDLIREAGEWRGWQIKEITFEPPVNNMVMATIVVYDKDWQA